LWVPYLFLERASHRIKFAIILSLRISNCALGNEFTLSVDSQHFLGTKNILTDFYGYFTDVHLMRILDAYERGHGTVFSVPGESGDEGNPAQAPRPVKSFLPVFQDLFLDP
jgi:hypothetical protein